MRIWYVTVRYFGTNNQVAEGFFKTEKSAYAYAEYYEHKKEYVTSTRTVYVQE